MRIQKFEPGTLLKIKDKYIKYMSENADNMYGYPHLIGNRVEHSKNEIADTLVGHFMWKESHKRELPIYGVICGTNDYDLQDEDFMYLVTIENKLGEEVIYLEPEVFQCII